MIRPGTLPLLATRTAPLNWTIRFVGIDLTGATIAGEVLQGWDLPGDPEIALPGAQTGTADGFRAPVVGTTEGVPHSDVRLYIDDGTLEAIDGPTDGGIEPGTTLHWVWRMWITPSGGIKSVYLEGAFNIGGPATGIGAGSGEGFDALVSVVDGTVIVNLGGEALYGATLGSISDAAADAIDDIEAAGGAELVNITAATAGPNGTMRRSVSLVTIAGSSLSSTVQDAMVVVEQLLRASGLISKVVRLNLQVGNGAAAARIPFMMRPSCGLASETGTIGSWTEADGLTGAVLDTGFTFEQAGLGAYNLCLGAYILSAPGSGASTYVLRASDGAWGFSPLYSSGVNFAIGLMSAFTVSPYCKPDVSHVAGGTYSAPVLGSMMTVRDKTGTEHSYRNGILLPEPVVPAIAPAPLTQNLVIDTNTFATGGYWVMETLTPGEAAQLHWIMHGFNVAIGRGVTAEGL